VGARHESQDAGGQDWRDRLAAIVEMMRELSRQEDPEQMVRAYAARVERFLRRDRQISLSRRGHTYPEVRITRDSERRESINPWTQRAQLPVVRGGLLAELIYGDEPRVVHDLVVPPDDPGASYLAGHRSLLALPLFDKGVALNMVLILRREPGAFAEEDLPENVWMSNLFGRATHNLVLSRELRAAYEAVDKELQAVADMQRSLLPARLPRVRGLDLAVHYQTSRRAGGDLYDFFPLANDRWGILVGDVSGHGTPAAVLMAITHTIAHTYPGEPFPPGSLLARLNQKLCTLYTRLSGAFVTAFYAIYDPAQRKLTYANAGHNPPRVKRCASGTLAVLGDAGGMPLGVSADERYGEAEYVLQRGDQVIFYTDGITEAFDPRGDLFGTERLDRVLEECQLPAQDLMGEMLAEVDSFADGRPADDDRTILIARVI
jgi:sigma-B regulation protein RsbU (phosphoserine phosphatase)